MFVEGWMVQDTKPTDLLCLCPFLNRKVNQKSSGECGASHQERSDPSLQVSPPVSFQTIIIFKYPISVAKMCFFDLLERQATRCSRGPLWLWHRGMLGCMEAGGHSKKSPLPWGSSGRDPGMGALVGQGACVHGGWVGVGALGGVQGEGWRKMPTEETGATGMPSARFSNPSRERNARECVNGKEGQAHGEHFPCTFPCEPRGDSPWFSGVVPESSPMTPLLVSPPPLPLHHESHKGGCGTD